MSVNMLFFFHSPSWGATLRWHRLRGGDNGRVGFIFPPHSPGPQEAGMPPPWDPHRLPHEGVWKVREDIRANSAEHGARYLNASALRVTRYSYVFPLTPFQNGHTAVHLAAYEGPVKMATLLGAWNHLDNHMSTRGHLGPFYIPQGNNAHSNAEDLP